MKIWFALPILVLLAACAPAGETAIPAAAPIQTGFDNDNLARSEACFAEDRSAALQRGQTLVERSPDGLIRISHALGRDRENFAFRVTELSDTQRLTIDGAVAVFTRAAGQAHDVTTDAVIYHRSTDGSFCTVVKNTDTGRAVVDAAAALHAELGA